MSGYYAMPESWLFVPAKERFLSGIMKQKNADSIIFDLEDSLKKEEKSSGLELLRQILKTRPCEGPELYIRPDGKELEKELEALKGLSFDGYLLPKFESTDILDRYDSLIAGKKIAALVESPKGIAFMESIASDKRISALALGGEDYCSALGVNTNEDALLIARGRLLLYAKAFDKKAIDTISTEIRDMDLFEKELIKTMDMGFDGKLMIHPKQADLASGMKERIPKEEIKALIDEFERCKEGAVIIKGKLYERPHIERLKKILKGE